MTPDRDTLGVVVGVGQRQGLGAAVARKLASEGIHVVLCGRNAERLQERAEEIVHAGGSATAQALDTTDEEAVTALFDDLRDDGRELEIAVYNAGNNAPGDILEMPASIFEKAWRVGCLGGFLVGREAGKLLVEQEGGGSIFFTGATASLRGKPPFGAFAAAKAGLRALAQTLARQLGPRGVHVAHFIIDGGIDGDMINKRFPEFRQRAGEDGMLSPDAIADSYWMVHRQHRSAWSHEIDLRPFKESF